uniref:Uncharacterized protein n=1 Tax=Glossina morsitans morsitans TaxID=37546 RepID=A0A1B0G3I3_GLOMM
MIEYSPKKRNVVNLDGGLVDVWRHMTVQDLSTSAKRSLDDIQEAMLFVKGIENLESTAQLDDLKIIQEIVKRLGARIRVVGAPSDNANEDESIDRDVTP